jgi:hypothetical protein
MKYQNYSYYKLPITMNPLDFVTLIDQFENRYTMRLSTTNIAIIQQYENENYIKFIKNGVLIFEFKDRRIDDSTFSRQINNLKFTFVNSVLERTEIIGENG